MEINFSKDLESGPPFLFISLPQQGHVIPPRKVHLPPNPLYTIFREKKMHYRRGPDRKAKRKHIAENLRLHNLFRVVMRKQSRDVNAFLA